MKVRIAGIGAWGPGFENWDILRDWLAGGAAPASLEMARPAPASIPPRERRRAPLSVKLAVAAAEQACAMGAIAPQEPVCVFASGMGDMDITDYMCRTLASDDPLVSPTKFHNSVHNAPVGYWSISQGAKRSSNAVAGFRHTVPASLLEATTQCVTEQLPVLWASQDIVSPGPFRVIEDIPAACAFALLLLPEPSLSLELEAGHGEWPALATGALQTLYEHNPTARLLPLLELIAGRPGPIRLPLNEHLALAIAGPAKAPAADRAAAALAETTS